MARMIGLSDLAQALAAAGAAPVRDGAHVTAIDLAIAAHAAAIPEGAAIWSMRLRYPVPPRFAWLARWRRARRRRAGIGTARLLLRWTPHRLDALIDGQAVGHLDFTSGGSSDERPAQDPAR